MVAPDKVFRAYNKWLKVHPRYYDNYGYDKWKEFNSFFYGLYDIPYDYHTHYVKEISRKKRMRARVNSYVRGLVEHVPYCMTPYLLTLTFTDDILRDTSYETRFTYVKKYLSANFADYIGCVDFGKVNGREHYHIIVDIGLSDFDVVKVGRRGRKFIRIRDKPEWSYGYYTLCPIVDDFRKCSNYAFKSSNYAFKSSEDSHKVFHKRGVSHWLPLYDECDFIDC